MSLGDKRGKRSDAYSERKETTESGKDSQAQGDQRWQGKQTQEGSAKRPESCGTMEDGSEDSPETRQAFEGSSREKQAVSKSSLDHDCHCLAGLGRELIRNHYSQVLGTIVCLALVTWASVATLSALNTWRLSNELVRSYERHRDTNAELCDMVERQRDALLEENMQLQGRVSEIEILLDARRFRHYDLKRLGVGGSGRTLERARSAP